jgi:hypothetical protein
VKQWQPHRIATVFGEVRLKLPRFVCAGFGCGETGVSWPSRCRSTPELDELQARLSALMPYRVAADLLQHMLPINAGTSPETVDGGRQVFGAVTRAETDITALIQRTLKTVSRTDATEVTAFTDGCPGLRAVLADAGVTKPPILDWFHIAMRLQHTKLAASNLATDSPERVTAKAVIVAEVERLHWRIRNGKARNAQRASSASARSLHAIDKYLRGQAAWLVNYACQRFRAGLRVGTSITEGTANFLVNRRTNKSQQMQWSRDGADLLLQVRCAVYNGTLGAGFGHRFDRIGNADPALCQSGMISQISGRSRQLSYNTLKYRDF